MPKSPINCENTHFYKIVCRDTKVQDTYVGHSTNFTKRKYKHKDHCNNPNTRNYNFRLYQFIRDNGGWDNFDMILINTEKCENSLEARKREREYIEQFGASLNIVRPFITSKEENDLKKQSYENKKEHYLQKKKDYYENNKYKILKDCKNIAKKTKNEYRNTNNNIIKTIKNT